jgi:transposase
METTLSQQSKDWRERRRLRAFELYQQGWKQKDIADKLDVTQGAVSQWVKRGQQEGTQALKKRTACGAPRKLSWVQRAQLPRLLARGAQSFGFCGDVWTCARIAQVIEQAFGVVYHPDYVGTLLKSCGWSYQKPVCRATQRDEAAIAQWVQERLPALKKGRRKAGINSCS